MNTANLFVDHFSSVFTTLKVIVDNVLQYLNEIVDLSNSVISIAKVWKAGIKLVIDTYCSLCKLSAWPTFLEKRMKTKLYESFK